MRRETMWPGEQKGDLIHLERITLSASLSVNYSECERKRGGNGR